MPVNNLGGIFGVPATDTSTTSNDSTGSDNSIWESLFGNLGNILTGAGNFAGALKGAKQVSPTDSTQQSYLAGLLAGSSQGKAADNSTLWIIIGVVFVVLIVLVLVFKKK